MRAVASASCIAATSAALASGRASQGGRPIVMRADDLARLGAMQGGWMPAWLQHTQPIAAGTARASRDPAASAHSHAAHQVAERDSRVGDHYALRPVTLVWSVLVWRD